MTHCLRWVAQPRVSYIELFLNHFLGILVSNLHQNSRIWAVLRHACSLFAEAHDEGVPVREHVDVSLRAWMPIGVHASVISCCEAIGSSRHRRQHRHADSVVHGL